MAEEWRGTPLMAEMAKEWRGKPHNFTTFIRRRVIIANVQ